MHAPLMNITKLKVRIIPKRMKITTLGSTKLKGMKVAKSIKSIRKINVAKRLRSFKRRTTGGGRGGGGGGGGGGTARLGTPRSTKWIAIVRKKIFFRPRFPHIHKVGGTNNKNKNKNKNKNIIIIHNNTSIVSNEEDNRSSCVEVSKEIATLKEDQDVTSVDLADPPPRTQVSKAEEAEETEEEEEEEEETDDEDLMEILRLREEKATIHIQSVFRGHLARRAFRALRSLVKLQAMVRGACVRKQASIALHCMNTMVRLQMRVRARHLLTRSSDVVDA